MAGVDPVQMGPRDWCYRWGLHHAESRGFQDTRYLGVAKGTRRWCDQWEIRNRTWIMGGERNKNLGLQFQLWDSKNSKGPCGNYTLGFKQVAFASWKPTIRGIKWPNPRRSQADSCLVHNPCTEVLQGQEGAGWGPQPGNKKSAELGFGPLHGARLQTLERLVVDVGCWYQSCAQFC